LQANRAFNREVDIALHTSYIAKDKMRCFSGNRAVVSTQD
jgi:hypothetical protein